jgi:hypothetical protein
MEKKEEIEKLLKMISSLRATPRVSLNIIR